MFTIYIHNAHTKMCTTQVGNGIYILLSCFCYGDRKIDFKTQEAYLECIGGCGGQGGGGRCGSTSWGWGHIVMIIFKVRLSWIDDIFWAVGANGRDSRRVLKYNRKSKMKITSNHCAAPLATHHTRKQGGRVLVAPARGAAMATHGHTTVSQIITTAARTWPQDHFSGLPL